MNYLPSSQINNPFSSFLQKLPFSLVFLAWLVFTLVLGYLYFLVPVNPDSAVFDYIGWVITEGGVPYVDAADQNWPGQMFIHAFSTWLFGNEIWSYRAFELVVIIPLSCIILFLFVDKTFNRSAALWVIPSYCFIYINAGYWVSGQRDIVAGAILMVSIYCLYQRHSGKGLWVIAIQGLFIALATIIRPTLLILAPLLFIADLFLMQKSERSFWTIFVDHTLSTITLLVLIGGVALLGLSNGALSGWYEISVSFALEVYSQTVPMMEASVELFLWFLDYWHVFLIVSFAGAVLLWKTNITALTLILTLVPAAAISALVQGKELAYHLSVMFPLLAVLLAVALSYTVSLLLEQKLSLVRFVSAMFIVLLVIIGSAAQLRHNYVPQVLMLAGSIDREDMYQRYVATGGNLVSVKDVLLLAEYVEQSTSVDSTVLFWGRPVHINTLSQRKSPFFAASFALLEEATPEFSAFAKWKSRLQEVMLKRPPELLMLVRSDINGTYMWVPNKPDKNKLSAVISNNLPRYKFEKSFGRVDVLRLVL